MADLDSIYTLLKNRILCTEQLLDLLKEIKQEIENHAKYVHRGHEAKRKVAEFQNSVLKRLCARHGISFLDELKKQEKNVVTNLIRNDVWPKINNNYFFVHHELYSLIHQRVDDVEDVLVVLSNQAKHLFRDDLVISQDEFFSLDRNYHNVFVFGFWDSPEEINKFLEKLKLVLKEDGLAFWFYRPLSAPDGGELSRRYGLSYIHYLLKEEEIQELWEQPYFSEYNRKFIVKPRKEIDLLISSRCLKIEDCVEYKQAVDEFFFENEFICSRILDIWGDLDSACHDMSLRCLEYVISLDILSSMV